MDSFSLFLSFLPFLFASITVLPLQWYFPTCSPLQKAHSHMGTYIYIVSFNFIFEDLSFISFRVYSISNKSYILINKIEYNNINVNKLFTC